MGLGGQKQVIGRGTYLIELAVIFQRRPCLAWETVRNIDKQEGDGGTGSNHRFQFSQVLGATLAVSGQASLNS